MRMHPQMLAAPQGSDFGCLFFLFWALMPEQTDTPCASPPINRNKSHSASSVSLEKLHHPAGITNWY